LVLTKPTKTSLYIGIFSVHCLGTTYQIKSQSISQKLLKFNHDKLNPTHCISLSITILILSIILLNKFLIDNKKLLNQSKNHQVVTLLAPQLSFAPHPLPRQVQYIAHHTLGKAGVPGEAVPEAQKLPLYEVSVS